MPNKPAYCERLPDAVATLSTLDSEWVGRRELEEALGVSKTVAWRVLKKCGVSLGPANALLCRRADLIDRLTALQHDGAVHQQEIERRGRLADFLERIRPDVVANLRRVVRPDQALALLSTTFRKLPPNVTLTPRSLHIDFFGTEDFLQSFGSVVYALHNDYEAIEAFIEKAVSEKERL